MHVRQFINAGTIVVTMLFFALTILGCLTRIGHETNDGGAGGTATQIASDTTPPPPATGARKECEVATSVAPEALTLLSDNATLSTCALDDAMDALPIDPASLDDAMVIALLRQYMPTPAEQSDLWLTSIDPSTIQGGGVISKDSCIEQYGCPWKTKCKYGFDPGVGHSCTVTDCGLSKCNSCPGWILELLKRLAIKSWCAYVCVKTGVTSPPVVAVGAGGISSLGGHFIGTFCTPP